MERTEKYEFCSVKQNTVDEFEFECSRCGQKFSLKSDTSVVKATTRPRSAMRNFVALSFLVSGQYFKDYRKILWTLGLDQVSSTQWIHIVEWLATFVKQIADWSVKEARTEAIQRKNQSSLHIQFDGFYQTHGHYSNNSSAQLPSTILCQEWKNYRLSDLVIYRLGTWPMKKRASLPVSRKMYFSRREVIVAAAF